MRFRITHTTMYQYSQIVGLCQNEARLQPRVFWKQQCDSNHFDILPMPMDFRERTDFFGNSVSYFSIQQPHNQLSVTSISEVTVFPKQVNSDMINLISWEQVRGMLQEPAMLIQTQSQQGQNQTQGQIQNGQALGSELLDARQYAIDSPLVTPSPELAYYAQNSFLPNRPLLQVVQDLMGRIHKDFIYDPTFTTIATPLSDVLQFRRGVCQDFAHLAIACLRAYGIAARYVSGYVETLPAPGKERMVGADASHAWFSVYIPGSGWLDFDPTNNQVPNEHTHTFALGARLFRCDAAQRHRLRGAGSILYRSRLMS